MSKVRGGQVFVEIGADPRKFFSALGKLNAQIAKIGAQMQQVGTKMAAFGVGMAVPVGLAVRQFAAFDDAIRATAAVSQATGPQLQMLNDKARELGATTSFTAIQVANLMTELGRAGFKPDEINAMTGAVLDLARATGTDAALSAGIMAATLRQFGLGATDASRAADVLTKAANSTFNTVEGLGESLKYAGPVAKSLGLSLEDTTAILGVLGNVGIQGSEAGTALRRLGVISAASGDKLRELFGVENQDADGNLKPLVQILDEINTATASMPVAERTKRMAEAFGLLGITSANVLSSTAGGVRGLANDLRNAEGTAAKAAKEMDAGLGGSFRIALSAIEGTALALGDALAPSLMAVLNGVIDVAGGITTFVKANQEMIVSIAKGIAIFTGVGLAIAGVGAALSLVAGVLGLVLSPVGAILAAIVAMGGAMVYFAGGLSGLAGLAETTFGGMYAAIAEGDLAGAMDVLWAGLYAGWLRGVEGLMGAVDPWVSLFQNTFTYLSANVLSVWDAMLEKMSAGWDAMESTVRKGWNFLNAAFQGADQTALNDVAIDNEMRDREQQRKNAKRDRTAEADEIAADREAQNAANADARRQATQEAEADVGGMARGKRETRARNSQFAELLKQVEGASSLSQLRELYEEFDALSSNGRLTSGQTATLETALEDAQERISKATSSMGGESAASQAAAGAGAAGQEAATSSAQVAGTFSSMALGGMGFGSSLGERQLKALETIASNTSDLHGSLVAE